MQEFRDLYTIFSVDLSSQTTVSATNQLTINIERREIFARNAETLQNPKEIDALFCNKIRSENTNRLFK